MPTIDKVLYTGKTHTTGGRDGVARSHDGQLDIKLSPPGSGRDGTNPEQLFAAGWSACFIGAMRRAAQSLKVTLPQDLAVDAEVDLCTGGEEFFLQARLTISLLGLAKDEAQVVVEKAHHLCPYSRMSRGNIDVTLTVA
ncbi:MAG TPA: organic hydroperoxide resistance protein [Stellaceae bacterium]|nr:organic hydroperoxide resistance protein [Stellaceae bacterium]